MAKNSQDATCCLCGEKGTDENPITREHVPPKQFHPKSVRSQQDLNLWIVPTCRACNESYKSDEEYFFHALYPLVANTNRSMGETILQDLRRRAKQPQTPALIRSLLRSSRTTSEGVRVAQEPLEERDVRFHALDPKLAETSIRPVHGVREVL